MKYIHRLSLGLLLMFSLKAQAQVYPVNGNAALIPPYSVYLADYTSRATERLMLNVVLNDVTRPELRVRLRIKIEGQNVKLETKPGYIGSELILEGGVQLHLSGTDLVEYFNPNNLNFSGISKREFEKTGALPQGFYTFCFEVLEYNRGVKISNSICAPGWLILNDPPLVNLPRNNEKLKPTIPQNVIFQWTPRHTGSPNSAFAAEYDIEMVEVWPATRNPNDAILTSPRILETSTRSTTFIYGPAETPLELGRRYAFRIKAKSIVGGEEYDLFKNNGYSEVVTFVYGDPCDLPQYVSAQGVNPSRIRVQWQGQFNHTGYAVRYRQAGDQSAQWFTTNTLGTDLEISSLKANTTYEYQVSGGCGVFESDFTQVATVNTKPFPVADYSCGLPMTTFNLDPSALVASLRVGDVIQAGDFDVQLTKVSGSNGQFTGEGVVVVPFLNNVKVKTVFENIMVNKENRMVNGYMNVTGAAIDIVPDEVTAAMDELSQALDKIEEGLNKAQDVLNDVEAALDIANQVIEQVKEYLPDAIIQQINDAKNEIAAAKDAMKNADTPEEKEAAQTKLKEARKKMKDSAGKALEYYAQAVKRFANIIWLVLKDIKQEISNDKSSEDLNAASGELQQEIYAKQGLNPLADSTGSGFFYIGAISEEKSGESDQPQLKSFSEKAQSFFEKQRNAAYVKLLTALVVYYSSEDSIQKSFKNDLSLDGKKLIDEILQRMKKGESDEQIKNYLKEYIKTTVLDMADHIIEQGISTDK